MKRRELLRGLAAGCALPLAGAAAAATADAANAPAAAGLPAVLRRPAVATPLAERATLLTAGRAGRRLLLAGERGIVLWSDDGGERWSQARVPAQVSLTALRFDDERSGWAAGHFGVLLRTRDGGESWTLAMDGQRAAQLLAAAAGDDAQRRVAQRFVSEGPDKPFFDLVRSGDRLLAVGAYGLALSCKADALLDAPADQANLDATALTPRLPNPRQLHLYAAAAADDRVYIAGEQGLLLRSTDRGASFQALPPPYKGSFFGLLLPAPGVVLAYGLRGNVWRSEDGGDSWLQVTSPTTAGLGAGTVLPDGRIVLLAQNGDLLLSADAGRRFERRAAASPFPATHLVATADGRQLVLSGLRGYRRESLA